MFKALPTFLHLRTQQFKRIVLELEADRVVFLLPIALIALAIPANLVVVESYRWLGTAVWLLVPLAVHLTRPDRNFLKVAISVPLLAMAMEYIGLGIPILFGLLLLGAWPHTIVVALASILIAWLPYSTRGMQTRLRIPMPVPRAMFEWRSGLRETRWAPIIIALVGLVLSNYIGIAVVAVILSAILITGFYVHCEPPMFIRAYGLQPRDLLAQKITEGVTGTAVVLIPVALATFLRTGGYGLLILYMALAALFVVAFAIALKYALYEPGVKLEAGRVTLALAAMFLVVPYFAPASILMFFVYRKKARINLNRYCNA